MKKENPTPTRYVNYPVPPAPIQAFIQFTPWVISSGMGTQIAEWLKDGCNAFRLENNIAFSSDGSDEDVATVANLSYDHWDRMDYAGTLPDRRRTDTFTATGYKFFEDRDIEKFKARCARIGRDILAFQANHPELFTSDPMNFHESRAIFLSHVISDRLNSLLQVGSNIQFYTEQDERGNLQVLPEAYATEPKESRSPAMVETLEDLCICATIPEVVLLDRQDHPDYENAANNFMGSGIFFIKTRVVVAYSDVTMESVKSQAVCAAHMSMGLPVEYAKPFFANVVTNEPLPAATAEV